MLQALFNLRANPLRTGLAGLAMAAAVAATAVIVTGLDALAQNARVTSARAFGSNTFVVAQVFGTGLSRFELAARLRRNQNVTRADLRFLERWTGESNIYSAVTLRQGDVTVEGRTFERAAISGVSSTLPDIRDVGVEQGRFFTRQEQQRAAAVAVIGASVADTLFPGRDALGARIRIAGRGFVVVGVQGRQGTAGGASLDRYVWMPLETFTRVFGTPDTLQIFARAADLTNPLEAEERARAGMRARRQLAPGVVDTFDVLAPQAARGFVEAITEQVGAAGPPISMMALLAAIIVVANTTLVSVTQRTREIGVRRAVGASRRQVLLEVLAESSLVSVAGAAAGLIIATAALWGVSRAVGLRLALEGTTAALSLLAALASGLVAGWYPAQRAANIEIVSALQAE